MDLNLEPSLCQCQYRFYCHKLQLYTGLCPCMDGSVIPGDRSKIRGEHQSPLLHTSLPSIIPRSFPNSQVSPSLFITRASSTTKQGYEVEEALFVVFISAYFHKETEGFKLGHMLNAAV